MAIAESDRDLLLGIQAVQNGMIALAELSAAPRGGSRDTPCRWARRWSSAVRSPMKTERLLERLIRRQEEKQEDSPSGRAVRSAGGRTV